MLALVVDDSRIVRRVAAGMLESIGYQVACRPDGLAALEFCREQLPDFILLDWHMPRMNGIDFLYRLRAQARGRDARVVVCSTENDPRQIAHALEAGADEYIMKPFDEQILRGKLEQMGLPSPGTGSGGAG